MMTCSVNKQLTVSLAGVSMAVLYLSLHLAVFTGLARINQLMWRMERGRIRNSQRKNCSSVFVRKIYLMWWGGGDLCHNNVRNISNTFLGQTMPTCIHNMASVSTSYMHSMFYISICSTPTYTYRHNMPDIHAQ